MDELIKIYDGLSVHEKRLYGLMGLRVASTLLGMTGSFNLGVPVLPDQEVTEDA